METIYYYNLPLIVSKSLTSTGIGSNTKTATQQLLRIISSLTRLSSEELIDSNSPGLFNNTSQLTIFQIQSSTKLKKTTNGFKQSSNCPAIQLTFFWQRFRTLLSLTVLLTSYFYRYGYFRPCYYSSG